MAPALAPEDFARHLAACPQAEVREIAGEERTRNLLLAISRRESGLRILAVNVNRDAARGLPAESRIFQTLEEAVAFVRARPGRSIDVGAMQVNLRAHPDAFATLEEAFSPAANVCAGARIFAVGLIAERRALCRYNTGKPGCSNGYAEGVLALRAEGRGLELPPAPPPVAVAAPAAPGPCGRRPPSFDGAAMAAHFACLRNPPAAPSSASGNEAPAPAASTSLAELHTP